jgi:excisionase family DNA binding protein
MGSGEYLSVQQAADLLGVSPQTVRTCIKRGELPAVKIGDWRISRAALDELAGCGSATQAISEAVAEKLLPRFTDAMRQALRQLFAQA